MLKKVLLTLTAIAVGLVGSTAIVAPAQATPIIELASVADYNPLLNERVVEVVHYNALMAPVDCPQYRYCVWINRDWSGSMYMWNTSWNGVCIPLGGIFNDSVSSATNKMLGWHMILKIHANCSGTSVTDTMDYSQSLSYPYGGWHYNDSASSIYNYA